MRERLGLVMLLMLSAAPSCDGTSPPGKPVLDGCRSPDKETFTCWWKPGSDGGLPTVHRLFYLREKLEGIHECPDYSSAGENSCFFGKDKTSIWVEYRLIVVAFNALGNTSSDSYEIDDVMKIVKPYTPENVTVFVNNTATSPYLHARWNRPQKADTKSGWVTIKYQLRVKKEEDSTWVTYPTGRDNFYKVYNVDPGSTYMVAVRCQLDESSWSEWSPTSSVKMPNHFHNEKPFWILVSIFSTVPLLAAVCILVLKRKFVKQWLLPPVPGPKIRGVDVQLLKNGHSEDVVIALFGNQHLPTMTAWTDQNEEYQLVSDSNNWLLTDPYISQKKKKSLIIPDGVHLEIQCKESTPEQNNCEKSEEEKDDKNHLKTTSKAQSKESLLSTETPQAPPEEQQSPSLESVSKALQQKAASGYVDIQQHENMQVGVAGYSKVEEVDGETVLIFKTENVPVGSVVQKQEVCVDEPDDYSRVKEVNCNMVLIQRHDSANTFCKNKENHGTEWTNQKTKYPHGTDCSRGTSLQITGNGYIDTVPRFYDA
ncbi:prolactin receptor b [Nematolebias whitei]|uniref:prolactin receptor b n=1 Tax=Nematolebias whitei TaxID=451745 RepID=UPI001899CFAC|nr:prolactin receptor b [Nematolebias whitei]